MAFLETKHTMSQIEKIVKDLKKAILFLSWVFLICSVGYNVFLIIKNLNNVLFIVAYSVLIALIITLFCLEHCIKTENKLLKNEKRIAVEKKRKIKRIFKILKFIFKGIVAILTIVEQLLVKDFNLNYFVLCLPIILLVLQIVLEFIIGYVIKQFDCFKLALDLDKKESHFIVKHLINKLNPLKAKEEEAIELSKSNLYSEEQLKLIEEIKERATEYEQEKKEKEEALNEFISENKPEENKNPIEHIKNFFTKVKDKFTKTSNDNK